MHMKKAKSQAEKDQPKCGRCGKTENCVLPRSVGVENG